jgi:23S rRNA (uracil1939-C5)-methyltransferase
MKEVKKKSIIENISIEKTAGLGKGLGYYEEKVVFVEGAVPGDRVDVALSKIKSNFLEGKVFQIKKASKQRVNAPCKHFGTCGGCKWQHFDYLHQLKAKTEEVKDQFRKIAGLDIEVPLALASSEIYAYRNKLDFGFADRRYLTKDELSNPNIIQSPGLGFHISGVYDKVLDIDECKLQHDLNNQIRNFVKKLALEKQFSFYNNKTHEGFLRSLILRNNTQNEWMLILAVAENLKDEIAYLLDACIQKFKEIKSVYYIINQKKNDSIYDLLPVHYFGKEQIVETVLNKQFLISPKSFFQTNPKQAELLYKTAIDFAEIKSSDLVYDLYTGTGSIAICASTLAKKVIGIEYVEDAIEDAKKNAKINDVSNCDFYAGNMRDILNIQFIDKNGNPDVVITDPPRAGMDKEVIEMLMYLLPQKIVYVSCNPSTQARDVEMMKSQYSVEKIQPVDMFPHTYHIENIILLKRLN